MPKDFKNTNSPNKKFSDYSFQPINTDLKGINDKYKYFNDNQIGIDMIINDELLKQIKHHSFNYINNCDLPCLIDDYNSIDKIVIDLNILETKILFDIDTNFVLINGKQIKFGKKFNSINDFKVLLINYYIALIYFEFKYKYY